MLAWTRRQIERGCLNSKSPSKSFLEFSRSVYEQQVGKGKGLKPMESFSLQTLTMNPQGCSKYSRWGKFSKKGHKRSTEGKKRDTATNLHRHGTLLQLRGDDPLCPPDKQAVVPEELSHFALLLLFFDWVFFF